MRSTSAALMGSERGGIRCTNGVTARTRFAVSVVLLLIGTAAAKVIAIARHKPFIAQLDGVVPHLTVRDTMVAAVVLEVGFAVFIWVCRSRLSAMVACSWLVLLFVCYRVAAWELFVRRPCPCLGDVLDWTRLPQWSKDHLALALLCYMGVGSLFFLTRTYLCLTGKNKEHLSSTVLPVKSLHEQS